MREILFKAKRKDNGEWIEGYYFYNPNIDKHFVHNWLSGGLVKVDKDTICQYTGLTDKNGNKIWENDKVYIRHTDGQSEMDDVVQVRYQNGCFTPWIWQYECDGCDLRCELLETEVIGNIFDNHKLIGE